MAAQNSFSDISPSALEELSLSSRWLKLMHYSDSPLGDNGYGKSKVLSEGYFLSATGNIDSYKELQKSIEAFLSVAEQGDGHAQCLFPARFSLLKVLLEDAGIMAEFPTFRCDEYQRWREKVNASSASLIFASSYLNSPSSMFGHTFLRFDPLNVSSSSEWLSYALNFGAFVDDSDNSILYAYKGLLGGYPGHFTMMPYYEKIKEYNRMENRSLWEYQLKLTESEVDTMLAHIWELREVDFAYYFFDENCSYRLLELIEVAKPGVELTESFNVHAIPIDTVRVVIDAGLVEGFVYRPSASETLLFAAKTLSSSEVGLAKAVAEGRKDINQEFSREILEVAYQYLQFGSSKVRRDPSVAKRRLALLRAINKKPQDKGELLVPEPANPHDAHLSQMVAVQAGQLDEKGYADLEFRASYHDLLDPLEGYISGGAINIARIVLRQFEGESIQLEQLNFVDISSLSPQTVLHSPMTWRVNTGIERIYGIGEDWLALQVNGGAGASIEPVEGLILYGLAEARAEYAPEGNYVSDVGTGVRLGVLRYGSIGTSMIEVEGMDFLNHSVRYGIKAVQNIVLSKNQSVRFTLERLGFDHQQLDGGYIEYRHHF